ncbi:hypothetical protein QYE76_006955 [Lolium multiflorum]|uniref:F-box domain-containing protein n=1 Tax=Lolium multiflorum TaxID=4521 RepID=A0AAD8W291_LOLMU|nr:hypothetical protein QYE76_006955 [Lolium multiflorum]
MATPHKRQCQQEPTTLMSLGDDMLAEILRRLTSLSSFARAAFACKRLRNVISSSTYSSVVASRISSPAPLVGSTWLASFATASSTSRTSATIVGA